MNSRAEDEDMGIKDDDMVNNNNLIVDIDVRVLFLIKQLSTVLFQFECKHVVKNDTKYKGRSPPPQCWEGLCCLSPFL